MALTKVVISVAGNTTTASSLEMRDFLTAFDLDRANIKSIAVYHEDGGLIIDICLNVKEHKCPVCSTTTTRIKGYCMKRVRHSVLNPVSCMINYRARRYVCPMCGKTFMEDNPFVVDKLKISVATVYNVLQELKRPEATFTYVAKKYHISPSSVANIFDNHVNVSRRELPVCLSFDETYAFKSDDSDYICVLLDYIDKKIVDILPSRRKRYLIDYFYHIPLEERLNVKYVTFDMWHTYQTVAKLMFPNSVGIIDKFHLLQELSRRVQRVRIDIQNDHKSIIDKLKAKTDKLKENNEKLDPESQEKLRNAEINYYLLKKFNWVLFSNDPKIQEPNEEKKYNRFIGRYLNLYDIYNMLIEIDETLAEAIYINDEVHDFYRDTKYEDAKDKLEELIIMCRTSNIKQIQDFSKTLTNWKPEIINSFIKLPFINRKANNALIENRNKTIKLIKHSANGYTCWSRFRNRVLYTLNDDVPIKF